MALIPHGVLWFLSVSDHVDATNTALRNYRYRGSLPNTSRSKYSPNPNHRKPRPHFYFVGSREAWSLSKHNPGVETSCKILSGE
jgi:hypothetical protein